MKIFKPLVLALLLVLLIISCNNISDSPDPDSDIYPWPKSPLSAEDKENILADLFLGNVNGIVEDNEKEYIEGIFEEQKQVWFLTAMEIGWTDDNEVYEDQIWKAPTRLYGPFYDIETLKSTALTDVPAFYVLGIYLIEKNTEYSINSVHYTLRDSINTSPWIEVDIVTPNIIGKQSNNM